MKHYTEERLEWKVHTMAPVIQIRMPCKVTAPDFWGCRPKDKMSQMLKHALEPIFPDVQ